MQPQLLAQPRLTGAPDNRIAHRVLQPALARLRVHQSNHQFDRHDAAQARRVMGTARPAATHPAQACAPSPQPPPAAKTGTLAQEGAL